MPETLKLRFAVGMIDYWRQLEKTAGDMSARGLKLENLSSLGFERVLGGKRLHEPKARTIPVAFSASPELIACTPGIFAVCLTKRLESGARSLKDALGYWLMPRFAQQFENAVHDGTDPAVAERGE